jgi:hypothetical protein
VDDAVAVLYGVQVLGREIRGQGGAKFEPRGDEGVEDDS